jgi:TonB-linked SusC/RagA family outer membrane protein
MLSHVYRKVGLGIAAVGVILSASVPPVFAQQAAGVGTVEGTVRENGTNRPVEGAQVTIVGTTLGTYSNNLGVYRIQNVPARPAEVRARFVGFAPAVRPVTVEAGQTVTVNFDLAQSALQLDQVVTTGTGGAVAVKKLGNTVATIEPPKFAPISSTSELLQGREAGVVGLPSGGISGEGTRIRIRGNASLSQSNEPMVFVDGVRINSSGGYTANIGSLSGGSPSRLDDIDPTSIERVEILKGAAAATLFGTEASNGVIQIFTKRGTAGAPRWDFTAQQDAMSYPNNRLEDNFGYAVSQAHADSLNQFWGRSDITPFTPFSEPILRKIYETGRATTLSGSVSGGTQAITYFLSGRYYDENGPLTAKSLNMPNNFEVAQDAVRRIQGTAHLTAFPFSSLKLGVRASYTNARQDRPQNNNNIYSPITNSLFGKPELANCRNTDPSGTDPDLGVASPGHCKGPGNEAGSPGAFGTPRELFLILEKQQVDRMVGALDASYTPITSLTFTSTFGVDYTSAQNSNFQPFGVNVDQILSNDVFGDKTVQDRNDREITVDAKMNWNRDFTPRLNSNFVVGAQGFVSKVTQPGGFNKNFPGPGIEVASAGDAAQVFDTVLQTVNGGYFVQEQVGLDNWIFLTGGARYDYSSAFGENAGGVLYPKASISVVPSDRQAWSTTVVSSLRLRAAYGKSGRQPGAFDKLTTFQSINGVAGSGLVPSNLGNPDLKPEVSTEWEAGSEVGFLEDRYAVDFTYWNRTVNDLLVEKQFPLSGGFQNRQLANVGTMKAHGYEVGLKGFIVNRPSLSVDLFANTAYLFQRVTSLGGAAPLKVGGSYPRYRNFIKEGQPPGELFGAKLMQPCGGGTTTNCLQPGQLPYDLNADGSPDTEAEALAYLAVPRTLNNLFNGNVILLEDGLNSDLGKPYPDYTGAFGGTATFAKHWRVYTLFEYKTGNYTYTCLTCGFRQASSRGRNTSATARVGSTLQNPASTPEQRLEAAKEWAYNLAALTPYDGLNQNSSADFTRWRELSLTYSASPDLASRIGARDLAITFTGRNLVLWTKYKGVDPEVNATGPTESGGRDNTFLDAVDAFGPPLARRFGLSIRLGY